MDIQYSHTFCVPSITYTSANFKQLQRPALSQRSAYWILNCHFILFCEQVSNQILFFISFLYNCTQLNQLYIIYRCQRFVGSEHCTAMTAMWDSEMWQKKPNELTRNFRCYEASDFFAGQYIALSRIKVDNRDHIDYKQMYQHSLRAKGMKNHCSYVTAFYQNLLWVLKLNL